MQLVNDRWYQLYRWIALGLALAALIFCGLTWLSPGLIPYTDHLRIGYFTGILAIGQIIYALVVYNIVVAKMNHWAAMLGLAMVQAVTIFGFLQTTGRMESPFLIWWALAVLMSGTFGIIGSAGTAFVTLIYFILASTNGAGQTNYSIIGIGALITLLAFSFLSHLFWKRHFVDADTEKVAALSGQLKANQKQSEILVQSLTDGVILINNEGVITLINPAAAKMTGWPVDEAIEADCRLVVTLKKEDGSELDERDNPLSQRTNHPDATTNTLILVSRTNKQIIVSIVTSPVINPKTQELMGSIIVLRDISVSHQSDKQRAEFISTASHEMRTPVAAIEGYLQLALNEKVSRIDGKARGFLEKALDSTHHLGQLFQDLLTSAKAEDGRIVSHPEVVELGEYIEQLADSFKFSAEKKGLLTDFVFGKSSDHPVGQAGEHVLRPLYFVHIDPDRLREVITNLFDNAVKYTPSGKIIVGLTGNNDVVQLFVRDTGPGISPEDLPHLFQKFYRVDNSATRTIGGTGLGLFICKKIIELYSGRIWAESQVGKGSTFYINLPRVTSQKAEELKRLDDQSGASTPINSLTTPV